MRIIERVADLLEPVSAQPRKRSTVDGAVEALDPGPLERTAVNTGKRSDFPADRDSAPEAKTREKSARGGSSRTLTIDLDRLREQSMVTPDAARTPTAESFRQIKRHIVANIANPKAEPGQNLVMITSALPGEGKTFCSINLAFSLAMEMDRTVLLVDADVAKPSVLNALGVEAKQGLMDVLLDHSIDLADVLCKTNIDKLTILPAGSQHHQATELLASETMRTLLLEMAERYHDRIIIFDSPPLLAASESAALAARMGQILVVVEAGKTTESALKDALHRIEARNVVGLLLNKGQALGNGHYGGYGYGYGYGYSG
jgi:receptor protein-tyrosine kinase